MKISSETEIQTGLQTMATNSTLRSLKIICHLISMIAVRFWKLCTSATLIILLIYWFYGGALTLLFLMAAVFGIFYYAQDMFLYYPDQPANSRIFVELPTKLHLPFENTSIKTDDGVNINVVLIKHASLGAPTVILLHGNAGNIGHRLAIAYYIVTICSCNVLLLEYRGYGKSSGSPSESGLYKDAEAGLTYLLQRSDIDVGKIFIYGSSLGGAVSVNLCSSPKYANCIAGLILENTFTSLPNVARSLFNMKAIDFLPYFCFKNKYQSEYRIGKVTMATLFLSGLNDELIPSSMMSQLYNLSGSKMKNLKAFPDGTHNETWLCPGYFEEFSKFIKEVLEKQTERKKRNSKIDIDPPTKDN